MNPSHPDDGARARSPNASEVEQRFRSPLVRTVRPAILGGVRLVGLVRRFGWSADGVSRIQAGDAPLIFAANHCSHADTAAILGTLPHGIRRRTCVAAALDVFGPVSDGTRHPVKALRRECLQVIVAAGFHAFAFDRNGPSLPSLRTAVHLVRGGWSLLLYPEGTRSRTGALGPFKSGVSVIAKGTGRPVVPVHVAGGRTVLPCGTTIPRPGHVRVRYGEPIHFVRGESLGGFTDRLRERVDVLARVKETSADPVVLDTPATLATVPPADVRQRSA